MLGPEASKTSHATEAADIFISYAHADAALVQPVLAALNDVGLRVVDAAEGQATMWGQDLESYLEGFFPGRVRSAMLFLSANYSKSNYCSRELAAIAGRAIEQPETSLILPVRLDDTPLPALLERFVCLDGRGISPCELAERARQAVDHWDELRQGNIDTLSDEALVQRIRLDRDKEAFNVLYERYYPLVLRFVARRRPQGYVLDIEDLAIEAMLQVWERIDQFDAHSGSFRSWVLTITKFAMFNLLHTSGRRELKDRPSPLIERHQPNEQDRHKSHGQIVGAVQSLAPAEREIVMMLLVEERSHEEIAEKLGVSRDTVRMCYHRALRKLRKQLVHQ